ncbi:MAG TPA: energy transducer TonB [Candidatus Desulfobacillus sp.]|nr:energy transducer TonB [Candidatus Desulfobacillus sp.]
MAADALQRPAAPRLDFSVSASRRPRLSRSGLAVVLLLHALVFWLLLRANVIQLPEQLSVLTVSLIRPVEIAKPQPEPTPPRPKPVKTQPVVAPKPVQLAAPEATPAPAAAVVPAQPEPAPPVAASPAPQPTQPRFDADYLDNPKPHYPPLSRRMGEQGRVVLRVHVGADGNPDEVQLHGSSGSPRLDQSALQTVRRWKFVPARLGNEPVAAWVLVPIAFKLKE